MTLLDFLAAACVGGLLVLLGLLIGLQIAPVIQQPAVITHQASGEVLLDGFTDIWRLVKVPEREAAQCIMRARRLGYGIVTMLNDKAGHQYVLFQLNPERMIK